MLSTQKFIAAVIVMCIVAASSAANAAQPFMSSVEIDAPAGTVLVNGLSLPGNPLVYMGRAGKGMDRLRVLRAERYTVEADLPVTEPGD